MSFQEWNLYAVITNFMLPIIIITLVFTYIVTSVSKIQETATIMNLALALDALKP